MESGKRVRDEVGIGHSPFASVNAGAFCLSPGQSCRPLAPPE